MLNHLKTQVRIRTSSLADPSVMLKQAMDSLLPCDARGRHHTRGPPHNTSHGLRKEFAKMDADSPTGKAIGGSCGLRECRAPRGR